MSTETEFVTASESAYKQIRKRILDGEFKTGQRLSMRKMAELTGNSVSPVIEALNKLKEDGLVESQPKWGARVAVYDKSKIEDLYMLRMAIECQIIRILAEHITEEQYSKCKEITDKLDSYKYSSTDVEEISALHLKFHLMLADMTGFPSLIKMLKRCHLNWLLLEADLKKSNTKELPFNWHGKLLDAIKEHNPDKAEVIMREHINDSFQDFR